MLSHTVHEVFPRVTEVTTLQTICEVMNKNDIYKSLLSEVHKLLRLYLTVPVSSATAERTFPALRHLKIFLRSIVRLRRD